MMNTAKSVLRSAKNFTFGFTDMQIKTREATSNDPGGPTTHAMNEIASATFDECKFREVMSILRKRLNDHGKNWRHVYKSLLIIDYCIQFGSERVIDYALRNIQLIKTLKEFQYTDGQGRDHGAAVRQKSRELTALLMDMEQSAGGIGTRETAGTRYNRQRNSDTWSNGGGGGGGGLRRSISSLSLNAQQRRNSASPAINGGLSEAEALKVALEASRADILASQQRQLNAAETGRGREGTGAGSNVGKLVDLMGQDEEEDQEEDNALFPMNGQYNGFNGSGSMINSQYASAEFRNTPFNNSTCGNFQLNSSLNGQAQFHNAQYPSNNLSAPQYSNAPYSAPQYPSNGQYSNSPFIPQQGHPYAQPQFPGPCNPAGQFSFYSQPQTFSQPQLPQQFYGQPQSFEALNASSSALFPPVPLASDPFQASSTSHSAMNPFVAAGPNEVIGQEKQLVDLRPSSLLTNPFANGGGGVQESANGGKPSRENFQ
jgi:hypothetical protein